MIGETVSHYRIVQRIGKGRPSPRRTGGLRSPCLYHFNQGTEEGIDRFIDCFERVVGADSGFARAHAALAVAWTEKLFTDYRQALALDPDFAGAHDQIGTLSFHVAR